MERFVNKNRKQLLEDGHWIWKMIIKAFGYLLNLSLKAYLYFNNNNKENKQ